MSMQAWVEILPDFSKIDRLVKSHLTSSLDSAGGTSATTFGNSFRGGVGQIFTGNFLADIVGGAARQVGEAIGTSIRSGIQYGLGAIDLASQLEQSAGAVTAIFKEDGATIQGFARTAATDVGLARTQYLRFATVVGAQLKNLGIPMAQVSGQTNDLIALGADLAAQFGGDTSTAVAALSSLLRGERDPIEQFGVSLKEADINAQVAAMGMADLTGEAEKQARIQATLALLYTQTADAQGTFAREQDTLAGKQQVLNALLTDAQSEFGEALLPTAIELTGFAHDELLPILQGALKEAGPALSQALEDALPAIKETIQKIADEIPIAIDRASRIAAAVGGVVETYNNSPEAGVRALGVDAALDPSWLVDEEKLAELREAAQEGVYGPMLADWFTFAEEWDRGWEGMWDDIVTNVNRDSAPVNDAVNGFLGGIGGSFSSWFTTTSGEMGRFFLGLPPLARGQSGAMKEAGEMLTRSLGEGIKIGRAYAESAAKEVAQGIVTSAKNALEMASPSKIFVGIGKNVSESMALGISASAGSVQDEMKSLVAIPAMTSQSINVGSVYAPPLSDRERGPSVSVTLVNPISRDPLQQLKEEAEMVVAGVWK